jgi:hypothetical protein
LFPSFSCSACDRPQPLHGHGRESSSGTRRKNWIIHLKGYAARDDGGNIVVINAEYAYKIAQKRQSEN